MSPVRRRLLLAAPPLLLAGAARAGRVLRPDLGHPPRGTTSALLWLHPHFTEGAPPDPPPFANRLVKAGWDLWRLDREDDVAAGDDAAAPVPRIGLDPLGGGIIALRDACVTLRGSGYTRIAILGESRGAFIALAALRLALQADSLLAIAPAAHGTRPERRPQALADFQAALGACAPGTMRRLGLVLFADDPYDPSPGARAAAFTAAAAACHTTALVIDRPPAPTGHGGAHEPAFDQLFGARLAAFLIG